MNKLRLDLILWAGAIFVLQIGFLSRLPFFFSYFNLILIFLILLAFAGDLAEALVVAMLIGFLQDSWSSSFYYYLFLYPILVVLVNESRRWLVGEEWWWPVVAVAIFSVIFYFGGWLLLFFLGGKNLLGWSDLFVFLANTLANFLLAFLFILLKEKNYARPRF